MEVDENPRIFMAKGGKNWGIWEVIFTSCLRFYESNISYFESNVTKKSRPMLFMERRSFLHIANPSTSMGLQGGWLIVGLLALPLRGAFKIIKEKSASPKSDVENSALRSEFTHIAALRGID